MRNGVCARRRWRELAARVALSPGPISAPSTGDENTRASSSRRYSS